MRGFSTIELLVALMLLSTMLIAAVLLSLGAPLVLRSAREHYEALALAEAALAREEHRPFAAIAPYSTTTSEGYLLTLESLLLPDETTKRLTARVSWQGAGATRRASTLTTYVANYQEPGDYPCDVLARGKWDPPTSVTWSLTPGDLLPADWAGGPVLADRMAATREHLALSSTVTALDNAPSFFLFSLTDGEPTYRFALPVSSTTAAVADVALTSRHAYVASASTCANPARCGQLKIIDLSVPRIVSQLLLSRTVPPYAGDAVGPVAARSVLYQNGYVYLGLEQTPTALGQEFNIIDVRDPAQPSWVGGFRIGRTVNAILVREGRAYLATNARATADVIVLDVTDPTAIREIARAALPPLQPTSKFGYAHALSLYGDELHVGRSYVGNADEWMLIDSADPAFPIRMSRNIGTLLNPASVRAFILWESQAVLVLPHAVEVWDRGDPLASRRRASVPTPGEAGDAVCVGNSVYVASTDDGTGLLTRITPL